MTSHRSSAPCLADVHACESERPTAVSEGVRLNMEGESVYSQDIPITKGHTIGTVSRICSPRTNPFGTANQGLQRNQDGDLSI